jgi:histidine triad (HIT) family protein
MSYDANCIFCQIINRQAPAEVVYRDQQVIGFMDIHPVMPGHMLVIPTHHTPDLAGLPDEYASQVLVVAKQLVRALRRSEVRCEAVNLFLADGEAARQSVFHTHLHIIPRYSGDGYGLRLHGLGGSGSSRPIAEQAAYIRAGLEKLDE